MLNVKTKYGVESRLKKLCFNNNRANRLRTHSVQTAGSFFISFLREIKITLQHKKLGTISPKKSKRNLISSHNLFTTGAAAVTHISVAKYT